MSAIIYFMLYLIIAIIAAKLMVYFERWRLKNEGIDILYISVDPAICMGLIWPISMSAILVVGIITTIIVVIKKLFFKESE